MKKQVFVVCVVSVVLILGIQIYRSYHSKKVTTYTVPSLKVNSPIRFILLSDLHNNSYIINDEEVLTTIVSQRPSAILLVGDMINEDTTDTKEFFDFLQKLTQIAPTYYSLGNHELSYIEKSKEDFVFQLEEMEITVLHDTYKDITLAGNPIRIGGMYDYAFGFEQFHAQSTEKFLLEFQDTDKFTLMLCHRPDSFVLNGGAKRWNIDLVVSGHDHGGQVILPFWGGLYGGDQGWFPDYVTGMHQIDGIHMIITNGLGSDKQLLPRFNNPPEIVVITVQPES